MVNTIILLIQKDVQYEMDIDVMMNDKNVHASHENNSLKYASIIQSEDVRLHISIEDQWCFLNRLDKFLTWLSMMDMTFGNATKRLPFSAEIDQDIKPIKEQTIIQFNLSELIHIKEKSLINWNSCAIFQIWFMLFIILVLIGLFGFLFDFMVQLIFYVIAGLLVYKLWKILNKRRYEIYSKLTEYID